MFGSGVIRMQETKRERQNEQIMIYLFVLMMYLLSFWIGLLGCSLFYVFVIAFVTFSLWKKRVFLMTERYIKEKETILHRKRALRHSESCEWLNFIINRWLVFCSSTISDILKNKIDPLLQHILPYFLSSLELKRLVIDSKTPCIQSIQAFEVDEGSRRPVGWDNIVSPPPGLKLAQKYQVVVESRIQLVSDTFMELIARLSGRWIGLSLDVSIENMELKASLQLVFHLDMETSFPHVSSVSVQFTEKPDIHFNIRVLRHIQLMEIPLLKFWVHNLVTNMLTEAIVDPGRIDFDFNAKETPHSVVSQRPTTTKLALGVLQVNLSGSYKTGDKKKNKQAMSSLELLSDTRYCIISVGESESRSPLISGSTPFHHSATFLVHNFSDDKVKISLNSKVFLTSQSLISDVILLSKYPLDQKHSVEESTEHLLERTNEILKLNTRLEYTSLPSWDSLVHGGSAVIPDHLKFTKTGVVNVCIHGASDLMGLDADGLSDPYCLVYNNGKKLLCTHYVPHTKNPCWEVFSQFIVNDVSKVMLSFVVYDWDGGNIKDDDFLGSAHITMSQETSKLIYQTFSLNASLLPLGKQTSICRGTIIVSVVFIPVENISIPSGDESPHDQTTHQSSLWGSVHQNLSSPFQSSSKLCQQTSDEILVVSIIQASDLVAKDRNGLSDPFCGVYINRQRKFLTTVKKETLNPVWNEQCIIELPKEDETLHILLWDHDLISKNDFLGCLDFSRRRLTELGSDIRHDGWFKLEKVESGRVQIKFQVFTQETYVDRPSTPFESSTDVNNIYLQPLTIEHSEKREENPLKTNEDNDGLKPRDAISCSRSSSFINGKLPHNCSSKSLANESRLSRHFHRGIERLSAFIGHKKSSLNQGPSALSYQLFVGIKVQVTSIQGLPSSSSRFYCRVKLQSVIDRKKTSIAKSSRFVSTGLVPLEFNFDVDRSHGECRMSSLIFAIKSSPFSTLIEKGFKLQEILPNEGKKKRESVLDLNGIRLNLICSYERNQVGYNISSKSLK